MSDNESPEQLDELLRQWSHRRAMSSADLDRLQGQVLQALHEQSRDRRAADTGLTDVVAAADGTGARRVAWFFLGVAATVLLLLGYAWLPRSGDTDPRLPDNTSPPSYAWLHEDQLRNKAVLLKEMETVFDHQLTWLAETKERVELGVDKRVAGNPTTPVAVRVVVQRRAIGRQEWKLVWAVDVVALSEERVRLKPRASGDAQLEMWTYALPDGAIAVDTDVFLADGSNVEATTSTLHHDALPTQVYSGRTGAFEVRVFQTAAVLHDTVS